MKPHEQNVQLEGALCREWEVAWGGNLGLGIWGVVQERCKKNLLENIRERET